MHDFMLKDLPSRIRYHDFPGDGIPILFIHGLGCAGSFDYPDVATQSSLAGYRRILVDLLGSGFSDKPNDFTYTISDHAEYLADFVTSLNLDHFVLFGHSMGGAIALSLAARCRDRLAQIVLSEANLDGGGGAFSQSIVAYIEREFLDRGFYEIIMHNQQTSNETWAASCALTSPLALYRSAQSLIAGQNPSWREILYALDCPKTFIFGEYSLPDPNLQMLQDHGVQIEVVPNAGPFYGMGESARVS
ncbi:alpha/beta hydrolase fold protein [Sulfobacillus acidophilus DSM 10332]|uniref:Alpha/beta hydrolase fold protein n=1 Tax=Sulfobacillus acidophilus (strain ATCC 700253 / DSM 10332 / NAL) TaxID=679936 RepID=G8TYP2_SULAD|nr:alpha/beta hydrolase fold protein [Sulfobacillus acidophilus DSM 10332]